MTDDEDAVGDTQPAVVVLASESLEQGQQGQEGQPRHRQHSTHHDEHSGQHPEQYTSFELVAVETDEQQLQQGPPATDHSSATADTVAAAAAAAAAAAKPTKPFPAWRRAALPFLGAAETGLIGGLLFGFASITPLVKEQATFASVCGVGNPPTCVELDAEIGYLLSWGFLSNFLVPLFAGPVVDRYGPRCVGMAFVAVITALLCMAGSSASFNGFQVAVILMGVVTPFSLFSAYSLAPMFPKIWGLVLAAWNGGYDLSSLIFAGFAAVALGADVSLNSVCLVYALAVALPLGIVVTFMFPSTSELAHYIADQTREQQQQQLRQAIEQEQEQEQEADSAAIAQAGAPLYRPPLATQVTAISDASGLHMDGDASEPTPGGGGADESAAISPSAASMDESSALLEPEPAIRQASTGVQTAEESTAASADAAPSASQDGSSAAGNATVSSGLVVQFSHDGGHKTLETASASGALGDDTVVVAGSALGSDAAVMSDQTTWITETTMQEGDNTSVQRSTFSKALVDAPFRRQVLSVPWWVMLSYFAVNLVKFSYYLSSIDAHMNALGQENAEYTRMFGIILPFGAVCIPLLGAVGDRFGIGAVVLIHSLCGLGHSIVSVIPDLSIQPLAFALFALFRSGLFTVLPMFTARVFGFANMGKLVGTTIFVSGLINYVQLALLNWSLATQNFTNAHYVLGAFAIVSCFFPIYVSSVTGGFCRRP